MTIRPVLAYKLREGTVLPSNFVTQIGLHVAKTITRTDSGIHLVTNQGEWDFASTEQVNFPRRPDGSVKFWPATEAPPRPVDLAIGDTIEPHDAKGSGLAWTVLKVVSDGVTHSWCYVTLSSVFMAPVKVVRATARSPFLVNSSRREERAATPLRGVPAEMRTFQAAGPYVRVSDGKLVMLAIHPAGRGRWPLVFSKSESEYTPEKATDLLLVRPPQPEFIPERYEFVGENGFLRHPKDPEWGGPGIPFTPEAEKVWALYKAYCARYDEEASDD